MSVAFVLALVVMIPVITSCGAGSGRPTAAGPAATQPAPAEQPGVLGAGPDLPPLPPRTGLAGAAVGAAEDAAEPSTELAVAVLDRVTGEMAVGERGTEPYFTASLAKVVVAIDVLDRRQLAGLGVSIADLALIHRALGPSDDNAMSTLWVRFDGVGAAARMSARLDLTDTTAPADPSQWGEMSVSATDMVRIWQYILDEMRAADSSLLISAMAAAPAQGSDGFDQAFGLTSTEVDGVDGPGAVAKQGWLCCFSDQYYLHSTGAVGADQRFLVALLTRLPSGPGWEAARQEVTGIAAAAVQALG